MNQFVSNYQKRLEMTDLSQAHNPQNVALGTLILWLGWLLFNGGSSGGITGDAGRASELIIANTIICPSVCGVMTFFIKPHIVPAPMPVRFDFQGITNGILAGLVTVTAACDCIETWAAFLMGILGAFVYCGACRAMDAL